MTQSMESQTMLPAQHEDVEDKRKTCPVRAWAEQHKTLLIVCFGVLGVFLLMMLGNRKTVLNIENQPSQAGGNTAKVMVIDNHGFSPLATVRTTTRRTAAIPLAEVYIRSSHCSIARFQCRIFVRKVVNGATVLMWIHFHTGHDDWVEDAH